MHVKLTSSDKMCNQPVQNCSACMRLCLFPEEILWSALLENVEEEIINWQRKKTNDQRFSDLPLGVQQTHYNPEFKK